MKFYLVVLITIACTSYSTAKVWEDPLDVAMEKCLIRLDLLEAVEISEKQEDCLAGCMLQEFKMLDENGKLLPNGLEDFVNNLPIDYQLPNLLDELNELKPQLLEAKDACEAGRITEELLGDFFDTEFESR